MNLLTGSMCSPNVLNKVTCLIKILLEQGNPFPDRFAKSKSFRFLICGTLLAGLVLSNAFKSNNMYNIVLPKQSLKFNTIDELLEHGYTVYTKLTRISYVTPSMENVLLPIKEVKYDTSYSRLYKLTIYNTNNELVFLAHTEISSYTNLIFFALGESHIMQSLIEKEISSHSYLNNISVPHLGLQDIIVEPLKILGPLFKVGLIQIFDYILSARNAADFWKKQEKFIADDLKKCNKSAWILPDYRAQQLTRMLHQSELHSDVGITSYLNTRLNFNFQGLVSSSIIRRTSMVPSSGLLNWWSNLSNRTDLKKSREIERPVKPKMSGNIQIIFYGRKLLN